MKSSHFTSVICVCVFVLCILSFGRSPRFAVALLLLGEFLVGGLLIKCHQFIWLCQDVSVNLILLLVIAWVCMCACLCESETNCKLSHDASPVFNLSRSSQTRLFSTNHIMTSLSILRHHSSNLCQWSVGTINISRGLKHKWKKTMLNRFCLSGGAES